MASSYAKQSFSFICIAIAALLFTSSQTFAQGGVGGGAGAGTGVGNAFFGVVGGCLLYTSPSPRDRTRSRMPSSA